MLIEVNDEQSLKAESPIDVTLSGIEYDFKDLQPKNIPSVNDSKADEKMIETKEVHSLKMLVPKDVTLSGIVIEVKEEQRAKA